MRVATFNILHGRSVHDGNVEPARLMASVKQLDADVLALQEVDVDQPRSAKADLTAPADRPGVLASEKHRAGELLALQEVDVDQPRSAKAALTAAAADAMGAV